MKRPKIKMVIPVLLMVLLLIGFTVTEQATAQVAHRVTVATSGGDYTTISAALAAITPSSTNPYLIDVMPGMYTESLITMKSYVHLRGAGREVTTIQGTVSISNNAQNVAVTGFTITTTSSYGIYIDNLQQAANLKISGNKITGGSRGIFAGCGCSTLEIDGNIITGGTYGIDIVSSSPKIRGNTVQNVSSASAGINGGDSTQAPLISGNVITGSQNGVTLSGGVGTTISENRMSGAAVSGLMIDGPSGVTVRGNIITANGNGGQAGLVITGSPTIIHNRITGNTPTDIYVDSTAIPNISHNEYDTISGTTGVGLYNVKSDGTAAPNP